MNAKERLLAACRRQPVDRVPVWIMRQAGRALPGYRALREKHSFLELCKTPELAAEVSAEPVAALGVDAAIIFSDILVVAEAMGLGLDVPDSGPVLGAIAASREGIAGLREFDPERETGYVGAAIRALGARLGPEIPVIGFAAAPWTLACYMLAGESAGNTAHRARQFLYAEPALLTELLEKIARATAAYLAMQIRAGAAVVQLFDTWAGELDRAAYDAFALPATRLAIDELKAGDVPVILYARGGGHLIESMGRSGATVVGREGTEAGWGLESCAGTHVGCWCVGVGGNERAAATPGDLSAPARRGATRVRARWRSSTAKVAARGTARTIPTRE